MLEVNTQNWTEEVKNCDQPIVEVYYHPHMESGPLILNTMETVEKMTKSILDQNIKFISIDVLSNPDLAHKAQIEMIPAIRITKNGKMALICDKLSEHQIFDNIVYAAEKKYDRIAVLRGRPNS